MKRQCPCSLADILAPFFRHAAQAAAKVSRSEASPTACNDFCSD